MVLESLVTGKEAFRDKILNTYLDDVQLTCAEDIKQLNKVIGLGFKSPSSEGNFCAGQVVPTAYATVKTVAFHGFTVDAILSEDYPNSDAGIVVYVEAQKRFAYAVPISATKYLWYKHWATEQLYQDTNCILHENVIFTCAGNRYMSVGGVLAAYVSSRKVTNIAVKTEKEYEALEKYDEKTFYVLVEE